MAVMVERLRVWWVQYRAEWRDVRVAWRRLRQSIRDARADWRK